MNGFSGCMIPVRLFFFTCISSVTMFLCTVHIYKFIFIFSVCVCTQLVLAGPLPLPRGPSGPLAVAVACPSASYCLGLVGQGPWKTPRTPFKPPPNKHPHQPPGQLLRPQNLHSAARWAPGHTVGPLHIHTRTQRSTQIHTHTHNTNTYAQ